MTSINHVKINACLFVSGISVYTSIVNQSSWLYAHSGSVYNALSLWANPYSFLASIVMFLLGSVMPDIDSSSSFISKIFKMSVPFEHRTWTHTIWAVLIIFFLADVSGIAELFWFLIGYFLHILIDSMSVCGICWLFPISSYSIKDGIYRKKGHNWYLYFVNDDSEKFVVRYVFYGSLIALFFCYGADRFYFWSYIADQWGNYGAMLYRDYTWSMNNRYNGGSMFTYYRDKFIYDICNIWRMNVYGR